MNTFKPIRVSLASALFLTGLSFVSAEAHTAGLHEATAAKRTAAPVYRAESVVLLDPAVPFAPPETLNEDLDPGEILLSPDDAAQTDAQAYADLMGVTLQVATDRLDQQVKLHEIMRVYRERYPSSFAGAVIVDEPTWSITVRFKDGVPAEAPSVASDAGVSATFDGTATATYDELENSSDDVATVMGESSDASFSVSFDLVDGTIEVYSEAPPAEPSTAEAEWTTRSEHSAKRRVERQVRGVTNGIPVEMHFGNNVSVVTQGKSTRGGARTLSNSGGPECTTGFPVAKDGVYGEMTAGHCLNSMRYRNPSGGTWDMVFKNADEGSKGDFQWNSTPGHPVTAGFYTSSSYVRRVKGIETQFAQGDVFCKYGRTTDYDCAHVRRVSVAATNSAGVTVRHLVATREYITAGGDSGGPWFLGNTAVGIHTGRISLGGKFRSAFSKFEMLDDAFPGMRYVCNCG